MNSIYSQKDESTLPYNYKSSEEGLVSFGIKIPVFFTCLSKGDLFALVVSRDILV